MVRAMSIFIVKNLMFAIYTILSLLISGAIYLLGGWRLRHPPEYTALERVSRETETWSLIWFFSFPLLAGVWMYSLWPIGDWSVKFIISLSAIVLAFSINTAPNHSRLLKYLLVQFASLNSLFGHVAGMPPSVTTFRLLLDDPPFLVLTIVGQLALGVALPLAMFQPWKDPDPADASSSRTGRWYRLITWWQGTDLASILVFLAIAPIAGPFFIATRYCTESRLWRRPALYLRPFERGANEIFSSLVAPAVHRYIPLTGWVHRRQSTRDLLRRVPMLWWSVFHSVEDCWWKHSVEICLQKAGAVVINFSGAGDATRWELDKAIQLIPPENICILVPNESEAPMGTGVFVLQYGQDEESMKAARQRLAEWAASVANRLYGTPIPKKIAPARVRRQYHPMLAPVVATAFLYLILFLDFMEKATR